MVEIRPDGPKPHAPVGARVRCRLPDPCCAVAALSGSRAAVGNAPPGWREGRGERRHQARQRRPALLLQQLREYPDERELQLPSDRKSTRLNSSHRTISYAVFCLKKKNKK